MNNDESTIEKSAPVADETHVKKSEQEWSAREAELRARWDADQKAKEATIVETAVQKALREQQEEAKMSATELVQKELKKKEQQLAEREQSIRTKEESAQASVYAAEIGLDNKIGSVLVESGVNFDNAKVLLDTIQTTISEKVNDKTRMAYDVATSVGGKSGIIPTKTEGTTSTGTILDVL
jgi:hypothetical protein